MPVIIAGLERALNSFAVGSAVTAPSQHGDWKIPWKRVTDTPVPRKKGAREGAPVEEGDENGRK